MVARRPAEAGLAISADGSARLEPQQQAAGQREWIARGPLKLKDSGADCGIGTFLRMATKAPAETDIAGTMTARSSSRVSHARSHQTALPLDGAIGAGKGMTTVTSPASRVCKTHAAKRLAGTRVAAFVHILS